LCARRFADSTDDEVAEREARRAPGAGLSLADFVPIASDATTLPEALYYARRAEVLTFSWVHSRDKEGLRALSAGSGPMTALFHMCGCADSGVQL
jgi:hypothetical protein